MAGSHDRSHIVKRPPYHLRLEMEDEHGDTVLSIVGSGSTPQEAFDEAIGFLVGTSEKTEPKALPPGRPELEVAQ